MPQLDLSVYLDYVDPVSYRLFERLRARVGGADSATGFPKGVRLLPFEICAPPEPLLDPGSEEWRKRWRTLETSDAKQDSQGQTLEPQPLIPWTRKAHELALHAAEKERFRALHEALFRAHLVDGLDIGRVDVLVELAVREGLDRTETKAVLDVDRFSDRVAMLRADALARGVTEPGTLVSATRTVQGLKPGLEVIDGLGLGR